jgi:hypothetical protein
MNRIAVHLKFKDYNFIFMATQRCKYRFWTNLEFPDIYHPIILDKALKLINVIKVMFYHLCRYFQPGTYS